MLGWISEYNEPLNLFVNAAMLIVWALYFQLLLNGYRRSRSSKILVNRANGHSIRTQCVVANMSSEAIYVEGIIAEVVGEGDDERITCSLTDHGGSIDPKEATDADGYQGPLHSGESVRLGTYQQIIEHVLSQNNWDISTVRHLVLTIVATYGPEDRPVAARREYEIIEKAGRRVLRSDTVATEQIRSRTERRKVEELMQKQVGADRTAG
ncbi:hypothetical protein [Chelativorans sp. YIM 93263]|uniref:hypothetical protein n=1 Tax=Chelativorans sp. YIM 93263 TaxID=2906648 RepID=UPI0023792DCB|nr:hypothetical protein [Chelativorans sp. YIM 93263]